jgi:rod shape-determining protein MreD
MWQSFRASVWYYRGLFVVLAMLLLFFRLLPIGSPSDNWPWSTLPNWVIGLFGREPQFWPGPDMLMCMTLAWVMRRPDYLPAVLIAVVFLIEDMILMRPPGLWAALMLMATEFLRGRAALTRELSFPVEWLLASGLMLAVMVVYRVVFAISLMPQPGFAFAALQTIWSSLCYPLVVLLFSLVLDIRKPATGEVDSYGRRL